MSLSLPFFVGAEADFLFFQGKNILVIGTTSEVGFLESLGICDAFSVTYHVPTLETADAKKVSQTKGDALLTQGKDGTK